MSNCGFEKELCSWYLRRIGEIITLKCQFKIALIAFFVFINMFKHFEVLKINYDILSNVISFLPIFFIIWMFTISLFTFYNRFLFFFKTWIFFSIKVFMIQDKIESLKNSSFLLAIMFFLIFFLNFFGLIPLRVSLTTQLILTLPLALMIWTSIFLSTFLFSWRSFVRSLIPKGVLLLLAPLLSVIELIRHISRPLTLAIRLTANITAGHVILALIIVRTFHQLLLVKFAFVVCFILWIGYLLVEFAISFIQGGIFTILNSVYLSEHI